MDGDSLLGYREPPEPGLPADVVVPLGEIESVRVQSDDHLSTAEAVILVGAGLGVAFFIFLISYLPTDT